MKKLSSTNKSTIISNNTKISKLLAKNEQIYLSELSDLERRLYPLPEDKRISIPLGYVRTKEYFIKNYNLKKLTTDYTQQSNLAYLMQYTDLLHYLVTRFYLYGQVRNCFYFNEIVILTSVLEDILHIITEKYRTACKTCKIKTCTRLINRHQAGDLKKLLLRLNQLNIISLCENDLSCLLELVDLRHKIHVWLMSDTIFNNEKFSKKFYNKYLLTFKKLISSIKINVLCETTAK